MKKTRIDRTWLEYDGELDVYGFVIQTPDETTSLMDITPEDMAKIIEKWTEEQDEIEGVRTSFGLPKYTSRDTHETRSKEEPQ